MSDKDPKEKLSSTPPKLTSKNKPKVKQPTANQEYIEQLMKGMQNASNMLFDTTTGENLRKAQNAVPEVRPIQGDVPVDVEALKEAQPYLEQEILRKQTEEGTEERKRRQGITDFGDYGTEPTIPMASPTTLQQVGQPLPLDQKEEGAVFPRDYSQVINPLNLSSDDLKEVKGTVGAIVSNKKSTDEDGGLIDFTNLDYKEVAEKYKTETYSPSEFVVQNIFNTAWRNLGFIGSANPYVWMGQTLANYAFDYTPTSDQIQKINNAITTNPLVAKAFNNELLKVDDPNVYVKSAMGLADLVVSWKSFTKAGQLTQTIAPFLKTEKLHNVWGTKSLMETGKLIAKNSSIATTNMLKNIPKLSATMTLHAGVLNASPLTVDPVIGGATLGLTTSLAESIVESLPKSLRKTRFIAPILRTLITGMGIPTGEMLHDYLTIGKLKENEEYIPALVMGMGIGGFTEFNRRLSLNIQKNLLANDYVKWDKTMTEANKMGELITEHEQRLQNSRDLNEYASIKDALAKAEVARNLLIEKANEYQKSISERVNEFDIEAKAPEPIDVPASPEGVNSPELLTKVKNRESLRSLEETFEKDMQVEMEKVRDVRGRTKEFLDRQTQRDEDLINQSNAQIAERRFNESLENYFIENSSMGSKIKTLRSEVATLREAKSNILADKNLSTEEKVKQLRNYDKIIAEKEQGIKDLFPVAEREVKQKGKNPYDAELQLSEVKTKTLRTQIDQLTKEITVLETPKGKKKNISPENIFKLQNLRGEKIRLEEELATEESRMIKTGLAREEYASKNPVKPLPTKETPEKVTLKRTEPEWKFENLPPSEKGKVLFDAFGEQIFALKRYFNQLREKGLVFELEDLPVFIANKIKEIPDTIRKSANKEYAGEVEKYLLQELFPNQNTSYGLEGLVAYKLTSHQKDFKETMDRLEQDITPREVKEVVSTPVTVIDKGKAVTREETELVTVSKPKYDLKTVEGLEAISTHEASDYPQQFAERIIERSSPEALTELMKKNNISMDNNKSFTQLYYEYLLFNSPTARENAVIQNIHDNLFGSLGTAKLVGKIMSHGKEVPNAVGYYQDKVISILRSVANRVIGIHESNHFLEDNFLTPKERQFLNDNTTIRNIEGGKQWKDIADELNKDLSDGLITREVYEQRINSIKEEIRSDNLVEFYQGLEVQDYARDGSLTELGKQKLGRALLITRIRNFLTLKTNKTAEQLYTELVLGKFRNQMPIGFGESKGMFMDEVQLKALGKSFKKEVLDNMSPQERAVELSKAVESNTEGKPMDKTQLEALLKKQQTALRNDLRKVQEATPDDATSHPARTKKVLGKGKIRAKDLNRFLNLAKQENPLVTDPKELRRLAVEAYQKNRGIFNKEELYAFERSRGTSAILWEQILNREVGSVWRAEQIFSAREQIGKVADAITEKFQTLRKVGKLKNGEVQRGEDLLSLETALKELTQASRNTSGAITENARALWTAKVTKSRYTTAMGELYDSVSSYMGTLIEAKKSASSKLALLKSLKEGDMWEGKPLTKAQYSDLLKTLSGVVTSSTNIMNLLSTLTTHGYKKDYLLADFTELLTRHNRVPSNELIDAYNLKQHEVDKAVKNYEDALNDALTRFPSGVLDKMTFDNLKTLEKERIQTENDLVTFLVKASPPNLSKSLETAYRLNLLGVQTLFVNVYGNQGYGVTRLMDSMVNGAVRRAVSFAEKTLGVKSSLLFSTPATKEQALSYIDTWWDTFKKQFKTFGSGNISPQFSEKYQVGEQYHIDPKAKLSEAFGKNILGDYMYSVLDKTKGLESFMGRMGMDKLLGTDVEGLARFKDRFLKGIEGVIDLQPSPIGWALTLGDVPVYQAEYNRFLTKELVKSGLTEKQAKLKLLTASEETKQIAHEKALETIYAEPNLINRIFNTVYGKVAKSDLPKGVKNIATFGLISLLPFNKIPPNLAHRILEYNIPVIPFAKAVVNFKRARTSNGDARKEYFEKGMGEFAKFTTGVVLYTIGSILAENGITSGFPSQDEKKKLIQNKPFSLNITKLKEFVGNGFNLEDRRWREDDTVINLAFLGVPASVFISTATMKDPLMNPTEKMNPLPFDMSGEIYEADEKDADDKAMGKALKEVGVWAGTVMKTAYNQTSLFTINALLDAFSQGKTELGNLQYWLATIPTAPFVSRSIIDFANYTQGETEYQRDWKFEDSEVFSKAMLRMGGVNSIIADFTGNEDFDVLNKYPHKYNLIGQKERARTSTLIDNTGYLFSNPHTSKQKIKLQDIYEKVGSVKFLPSPIKSATIEEGQVLPEGSLVTEKQKYQMPKEMYEELQKEVGSQRYSYIEDYEQELKSGNPDAVNTAVKTLGNRFKSVRKKKVDAIKNLFGN